LDRAGLGEADREGLTFLFLGLALGDLEGERERRGGDLDRVRRGGGDLDLLRSLNGDRRGGGDLLRGGDRLYRGEGGRRRGGDLLNLGGDLLLNGGGGGRLRIGE
jgi:hypothetical protein